MLKHALCLLVLLFAVKVNAQMDQDTTSDEGVEQSGKTMHRGQVYKMNYKTVVPIVGVSFPTILYAFSKIYKKTKTPDATILALDKNNIPAFDRWATKYHDINTDKISYYPFYAVMPLPAILFIDRRMRKDALKISVMYLEAFAFTGLVYSGSVYFVDRYRPDVYNTSLLLSYRTNGNYRNSFFAGHVAVMSTSAFFMAKVYADYHPESNWKWVFYGGAAAATLGMGYMRLEAGKHFPSDILLGTLVGTTSGILTPAFHRNRNPKDQKWSLTPTVMEQGPGLSFTYKL
jgi:membrane-associated phospholipid phosphatase